MDLGTLQHQNAMDRVHGEALVLYLDPVSRGSGASNFESAGAVS